MLTPGFSSFLKKKLKLRYFLPSSHLQMQCTAIPDRMVFTKVIISAIWFTSHLRKVSRNFSIAHLSYCVEKIRVSKCHNFRILLVKTKGASIVLTTKEDYLKMVFLRLSYYDNDNNVFFFDAISFVIMLAPF